MPIRGRLVGPDGQPLAAARVRVTALMIPPKRDLGAHLDREAMASVHSGFLSGGPSYERSLYRPALIPGLVAETQTDAEGRFTLTGLGRDRLVNLTVTAPSIIDTRITVMTRDARNVRTRTQDRPIEMEDELIYGANFTLVLKPGLTVRGIVRDRDTKAPIAGMWVTRFYDSVTYSPVSSLTNSPAEADAAVSDENGRFAISGLNPELLNRDEPHRGITALPRPGGQYAMSTGIVGPNGEVVIECVRGIPFRLKLFDEQGQPVEATAEYNYVSPNPQIAEKLKPTSNAYNRAARRADGSYEGFVLPGPGAVLVKTPGQLHRPAHVDPKAFFAPGRTNWTAQEATSEYGTPDTLVTGSGWNYQRDFSAIVLVNPPADSGPLELSATVVTDRPRRVHLVDADGEPVPGVRMDGKPLRAASVDLTRLHPVHPRRLTFLQPDRRLIGFLIARGDGDTPYTVVMQPWGTITGRLVAEDGEALPILKGESDWREAPSLSMGGDWWPYTNTDAETGQHESVTTDDQGRFRVESLVPGQRYSAKVYPWTGATPELVFENATVRVGDVRDLGDIRTKLPFDVNYVHPTAEDQQAAADVPDETWGEPVNGLRVALVLRSPAVDESDHLRFEIVAENASDREIRFSTVDVYETSYYKIRLVDAEGKPVPRLRGSRLQSNVRPGFRRFALKPNERTIVGTASLSSCG